MGWRILGIPASNLGEHRYDRQEQYLSPRIVMICDELIPVGRSYSRMTCIRIAAQGDRTWVLRTLKGLDIMLISKVGSRAGCRPATRLGQLSSSGLRIITRFA
jgi:hypothetical protein